MPGKFVIRVNTTHTDAGIKIEPCVGMTGHNELGMHLLETLGAASFLALQLVHQQVQLDSLDRWAINTRIVI